MKWIIIVLTIIILVVIGYFGYKFVFPENMDQENLNDQPAGKNPTAIIETSMGNFEIGLYQNDAPDTVANFIKLAEQKFYDNLVFHRVVKGFVIQGGDPNSDGTGGPGYQFNDELNPATKSYQAGYVKGVVAMANSGPNTNGSQWFVTLADLSQLPQNYTIFGKVISGQEVVDAIGVVEVNAHDKPLSPVVIKQVTITK